VFIGFSVWPLYKTFGQMFRAVLFTVASIITTTGFSTVDFDNWPLFAHIILLMLMFFGAMAGSTGGGIKTTRVAIYIKTSIQEVRRSISPHRRLPIRFEGKTLDPDVQRSVVHFFTTYIMLFILFLLIVSLDSPNFTTAFSAVAATINNIGPGLDAVGPTGNYTDFSHITKITLCFSMLAGRLELFPILFCSHHRVPGGRYDRGDAVLMRFS
jgi:trk system potassium uptake protein TrkH